MRADNAVCLALREIADPACRRCGGAGATGRDVVKTLCRCVRERAASHAQAAAPLSGADEAALADLPYPWGIVTRRAQRIHAAALLDMVPDNWS